MLVSLQHKLAFLAVPKTGTTAIEQALRPDADIVLRGNPQVKHMNAETFEAVIRPYLKQLGAKNVRTLAVMRNPLDWLESWYFYRSRIDGSGKQLLENSTKNISWPQFVKGYLAQTPPQYARVGLQSRFLGCKNGGDPCVEIVFPYDHMHELMAFLSERLGRDLAIEKRNASVRTATVLPPDLQAKLDLALEAENALYARVMAGAFYPKRG